MVIKRPFYERRSEDGFHFSHLDEYRKLKSAEYTQRTKDKRKPIHSLKAKRWSVEHREESRLKAQIWRANNQERLQLKNLNRKLNLTDKPERKWDKLSFAKSSDESKIHIVGCKDNPSVWSQGTSKQNKSMCDINLWIRCEGVPLKYNDELCTHCFRLVKYWGGTKYLFHHEPPTEPTHDQISAGIVDSFHRWSAAKFADIIIKVCGAEKAEAIAIVILKLIGKETEKPKEIIPVEPKIDRAWEDGQMWQTGWTAGRRALFKKLLKEMAGLSMTHVPTMLADIYEMIEKTDEVK